MPFLPDGTRLYTHSQGVALDYAGVNLATSTVGRMRTEVGGALVQMYDASLAPISSVVTNAETAGFPVTYAPVAQAVWDFGSLQLPTVSVESIAAGESALATVEGLRQTVATIQGSYVTKDYVDSRPTSGEDGATSADDLTDVSDFAVLLLREISAADMRKRLGAGTSDLAVGTRSTDALRGDYRPDAAAISDSGTVGRLVVRAPDAASARSAMGAASTSQVDDLNATMADVIARLRALEQGTGTGGTGSDGGTITPTPGTGTGGNDGTTWPQHLTSTPTALPSWTNSTEVVTSGRREVAGDIPEWTATRSYVLPNLPTSGRDITAAWNACFGSSGTVQDGDVVTIPAGTWARGNLDMLADKRYRVVGGTASLSAPARLVSTSPTEHAVRVRRGTVMLKGASRTARLEFVVDGVAGRGDKNQQGMTCLLLDSSDQTGTGQVLSGFRAQDLLLEGAKAAGFFAINSPTDYWLNRVHVKGSLADAFHNTGGANYGVWTDCISEDHGDDGWAAVQYAPRDAPARQSHHMQIYRQEIRGNAHGRGLANISCRDIVADQVRIVGSAEAGILIDPAETYPQTSTANGVNPKQAVTGTAYRRIEIIGCNWGNADHGSVFMRAGSGTDTIPDGFMESVRIIDAKGNRNAVRASGGIPPKMTLSDFVFTGGKSSSPTLGGNANSGITVLRWDESGTSTTADTTPPTIVFEVPSRAAVLKGTLVGFPMSNDTIGTTEASWAPTKTHLQSNAQVFQGKAGDTRGLAKVEVYFDSDLIHTQTTFDSYGSWKTGPVDTTARADGDHTVRAVATAANGQTTSTTHNVSVLNAVVATPTPTPTGGRPSTSQTVLLDVDAVASGTVGASSAGIYDTLGQRHFTQDATSLQPLVVDGPKSGQKAVRFDGGYLRCASGIPSGQQRITLSMVMRMDGAPGVNRPALFSAAAHATDDYSQTAGSWNITGPAVGTSSSWNGGTVGGSVVATNDSPYTVSPAVAYGAWVLVEVEVGTDGQAAKVWIDGTSMASLTGRSLSAGLSLLNMALGTRIYANGYSDRSRYSLTRMLVHSGARVGNTLAWAQSTYGVASGVTPPPADDTTAPSAPTNVTASRTSGSSTAGTASWAAATDASGIKGYNVYWTPSGGTATRLNTALVTTTTYALAGLTAAAGVVSVEAVDNSTAANVGPRGTVSLPAVSTSGAASPPSTSASRLMYVDTGATATAADLRITDLRDEVSGKVFSWATDAERAIARVLPSGRKVAEFLNGRALLEGTGIAGQAALTVTLVMSQRNLVTALRSGYVAATPANANDFDKTVGQWAIGSPAVSGDTTWAGLTVSGTPQSSGNYTGFSRPLDAMAVVQVSMSADGIAPTVYVDGVALTTSATNPTTTGTLFLDRILLGARWYDGGPKDGQQFRLGAMLIHAGRLTETDRNAVRGWAAGLWDTPPVGVSRTAMTYGTDRPSDLTAGVPAGSTFSSTVTANTFFDTAGATITGVNYKGRVVVRAANVTFRNCLFEGTATALTGDDGLVNATAAAVSSLVVEDCTFRPQTPSMYVTGILGHDYTVRRCVFENCVDACGVYNTTVTNYQTISVPSGVKIHGNVVRMPSLWTVPSSRHSDLVSHNDGTQGQAGDGAEVIGNVIYGTASRQVGTLDIDPHGSRRTLSGVLLGDLGPTNGWKIEGNWIESTRFGVEMDGANKTTTGRVVGNRLRAHVVPINLGAEQTGIEVSGNTVWGTGSPVGATYQA